MLFFSLVWREVTAQTTTYHKAESFLFSFKENSDLFLADYGDNAYQLERMGQLLDASRNRLLKGDNHLLIVSHVDAYGYEEDAVVNEASLRASRIRAYLKTRFDIPHDCVAFYIDRSGSYRDQIHIYNVYRPLPWFANISIHYSESRYPIAVKAAIGEYGAIPYVDLYRRGEAGGYDREVYRIDDPLFDRTELEDYRLASVTDTIRRNERVELSAVNLATTVTTKEVVRVVTKHKERTDETATPEGITPVAPAVKKKTIPMEQSPVYLAVKTNLLPWFGVVPSLRLGTGETKIETGAFMPVDNVDIHPGKDSPMDILPVAGRWRCRACIPTLPIKTRRAIAGLSLKYPLNQEPGCPPREGLPACIPGCLPSMVTSMYVATRSIALRIYFTAGRAVSGRRACRWGIVSPWPEVWGWG